MKDNDAVIVDALTHVTEQIAEYGGPQKQAGGNVHVLCPFHDERTPSCSVNLSYDADVGIGTFFCYGCGEKGGWNKFADKASLKQVKKWQHFEGTTEGKIQRVEKKQVEMLGKDNRTIKRLFDEIGNAVIPWPEDQEWRNYSGKLIRRVEGFCYNDDRRDELMLVLPVYTNGRYRGGVRAFFEKQKNGLSYMTIKGDWVKSYGLLGYDYLIKKSLWGADSVVIVEGPRDWLRLIKNRIPALAMLGALMMNEKKMMLIASLGVRKVYAMPDNDRAGKDMANLVKEFALKAGLEFEYLKLPRKKDERGKLIKMDPDNAPAKIIKQVKKIVFKQ